MEFAKPGKKSRRRQGLRRLFNWLFKDSDALSIENYTCARHAGEARLNLSLLQEDYYDMASKLYMRKVQKKIKNAQRKTSAIAIPGRDFRVFTQPSEFRKRAGGGA